MNLSLKRKSMNATKITKYGDGISSASSLLRLVLHRGEVYRLPRTSGEIRVLSGQAWLSYAGQDIILAPGGQASFAPHKVVALVSVLGDDPLVFEMWTVKA